VKTLFDYLIATKQFVEQRHGEREQVIRAQLQKPKVSPDLSCLCWVERVNHINFQDIAWTDCCVKVIRDDHTKIGCCLAHGIYLKCFDG